MAKRSRRRPSRHERNHAGCMWGFISIFDFRHGRSTKRLLADRRHDPKQAVGGGYSSNQTIIAGLTEKCEGIVDAEESKIPMLICDVSKTSVKELMEEEMVNEQGSENPPNDSEMGSEKRSSDYGNHLKKHQKKRNRNRNHTKSGDVDITGLDVAEYLIPEISNHVSKQNLDLEKIMEELAEINQSNTNCLKHDLHSDLNTPSDQATTVVEEKVVAAVKLFIEQRLSSSKHFREEGNNCCSKELMDALQLLSLNKGLFLKLLQDPNSILVKHVEKLEDALLTRDKSPRSLSASNLSEEKPASLKLDESSGRKQRNFFRRRTKSMESYPLGGEKDFESANKIVILKPGPAGAQSPGNNSMVGSLPLQSHNMNNKANNEKNASQFSFTEIKRKLRHAMGKERQGVSPDRLALKYSPKQQNGINGDKSGTAENLSWSSPNRNHFYTERFLISSSPSFKKGEPVGKLKENGLEAVNETGQFPRVGGSNLYIEAKKHLSEMVKNGDENPESMARQLPKSLGRILSLPEYNGSPCCSPRKYGDDIFITAQMRLSPRGMVKNDVSGFLQDNHNNLPSPRQNLDSQPSISGGCSEDKVQSLDTNDCVLLTEGQENSIGIQSCIEDVIVPEVQSSSSIDVEIEEMTESWEEEKIITCSSKSSNNFIHGDLEKEEMREVDNTENASQLLKESLPCSKQPLFEEDQILSSPSVSPPHCPASSEIEDSECVIDKMERPSPISVLDPLFTDDDISPASTLSQSVQKEIQPRHIHFEEQSSASDQGICTRISLEDEESAFEYVEAVLLGSGLNWDEFLLRWLSMDEILDSSLFEEVELFSSRPHHDQKLLFNSANDALKEVCDSYFGCFTGISHVKLNIRPPPTGMDLIHRIWQQVEQHLFQHPHPHSLDQLVKTDLARSRKWMDLQSEIELFVFEMGETIFIELVEEIVLSFEDDTSECEFSMLQAESSSIENTSS